MTAGAPQHTVVPVYAQPDQLTCVFVCERCGQPLTGPHDLCDDPRHMGSDRTGVGHAVRSTELARLAGAARAALGPAGLPPRQRLVAYMAALAGLDPSGYIELRHRRPGGGMGQRFFDARQPNAAATAATCLAQSGDVYVGCAPRHTQAGHKQAVAEGWVLWVDCDDPQATDALERFSPQPAIVVRSSGRGRHAYWPLQQPLEPAELERANRRLAFHLSACQSAVTNAAAILRPPATLNWKYQPPAPVTLERFTGERLHLDQIVEQLPEPPTSPRPNGDAGPNPDRAVDPLLAIAPATYVAVLTGRQVGRDGKVQCPFHPDRQASLHAYPQPAQGWACFSARCWQGDRPNGGDIYTLAGQVWGLSTRGPDFVELRRRLQHQFLEPSSSAHAVVF